MKKILSVFLALTFALLLGSVAAISSSAETFGDFQYGIIQGGTEVQVSRYLGAGGDVEIPATIEGIPVTGIGQEAFYFCETLTSVVIPDSVTSIGQSAFYHCTALTSVTLPAGLTRIGERAFSWCKALTSVAVPSGVTRLESGVFVGCKNLTELTLPESLVSIGESAVSCCESLTSIVIPDSVTFMEDSAFSSCGALTAVTRSKGLTEISGSAFAGCEALQHVTLPDGVTRIGSDAFMESGLTEIVLPEGLVSIGVQAFAGCKSLSCVTFPESLTDVAYNAFVLTPWWEAQPDGLVYIGTMAYHYKGVCPTSVTIQDGTTRIDGGAFYDSFLASVTARWNAKLEEIVLPSSVTAIGRYAFYGCNRLDTVRYDGSRIDRVKMKIDEGNDQVLTATWTYRDTVAGDPGDANGDASIDMKDVLVIRQSIAGMTVTVDANAADASGDRNVDMKDVLLVRLSLTV